MGDNLKKIKKKFKFSPINLLIILYQLTKIEAPSCNTFRYHGYKFSKSKSEKGDNSKKKIYTFFNLHQVFQSPNLQREFIRKK